jgi:hypothetical protein
MKWGRSVIALLAMLATVGAAEAAAVAGTPLPPPSGWPGQCSVSGSMQFKPPLGPGAGAVAITVKLKSTKGSRCSGAAGDGRNVGSLQLSGVGVVPANSCAVVLPSFSTTITSIGMHAIVKWKMSKGLLPKKISNSTISAPTLRGTKLIGTNPRAGLTVDAASVTDGSFNGFSAGATLISDQDANEINAACDGKGLKKLTFGVKASKDDLQIGSGDLGIAP